MALVVLLPIVPTKSVGWDDQPKVKNREKFDLNSLSYTPFSNYIDNLLSNIEVRWAILSCFTYI